MDEAKRRLSAVWFSDIVGYTALSGRDEPLALKLIGELQALARQIVEQEYAGRIVKFIGDAVLAEFDSTERAVRAAVSLQERYTAAAKQLGISSTLHTGVHLGEVVATNDGDLYGDGINTAARLQAEAPPGQVIVSEDVWRQLRQRPEFRFEALGAVDLRGITTRVEVYNVLFGAGAALAQAARQSKSAGGRRPSERKTSIAAPLAAVAVIAAAIAIWIATRPSFAPPQANVAATPAPAVTTPTAPASAPATTPPASAALSPAPSSVPAATTASAPRTTPPPSAAARTPAPTGSVSAPPAVSITTPPPAPDALVAAAAAATATPAAPPATPPPAPSPVTPTPIGSATTSLTPPAASPTAPPAAPPAGAPGMMAALDSVSPAIRSLLENFAAALALQDPVPTLRQLFPTAPQMQLSMFSNVRQTFGADLRTRLMRVESQSTSGNVQNIRFFVMASSSTRDPMPLAFDASLTDQGGSPHFTRIQRVFLGARQ